MYLPHWLSHHSNFLYPLFYALPFLLVSTGMLWLGYKKKYPMASYALILLCGRAGFLMGTWLGGMGGRSTLFSLVFGVAFVVGAIRLFRFDKPVLDLYVYFLPLALAVQRLGCLSAGCCYGLPSTQPWAIHYALKYIPIPAHTIGVHPVPIYLIVGYIGVWALSFYMAKRIRFTNGLTFFCLAGVVAVRFVSEFFRDPASNQMLANTFWGLKQLQWVNVVMFAGFVLMYYRAKAKYMGNSTSDGEQWHPYSAITNPLPNLVLRQRQYLVLVSITLLYVAAFPILNKAEWVLLLPQLLFTLGFLVHEAGKLSVPRIVAGVLTGVAVAFAAVSEEPPAISNIRIGYEQGQSQLPQTKEEEECKGPTYSDYRQYNYVYPKAVVTLESSNDPSAVVDPSGLWGYVKQIRRYGLFELQLLAQGFRMRAGFTVGYLGFTWGMQKYSYPDWNTYEEMEPYVKMQIGNHRSWYVFSIIDPKPGYVSYPYWVTSNTTDSTRYYFEPEVLVGVGGYIAPWQTQLELALNGIESIPNALSTSKPYGFSFDVTKYINDTYLVRSHGHYARGNKLYYNYGFELGRVF